MMTADGPPGGETNAELKTIFWSVPALYFRVMADGTIVDFRPGRADALHVPPERLFGRRMAELLPEPAGRQVADAIAATIAKRVATTVEYPLTVPSGEKRFEAHLVPYAADQAVIVVRDISDQHRALQAVHQARADLETRVVARTVALEQAMAALRESEERFRALAENSPDVIMRFDRECRHLYVNGPVAAMTGIPAPDFIGKTHRELGFPDGLCDLWVAAIQSVFSTGKLNRIEFELPSHMWIDWLLVPEFAADRRVAAVMADARDITAIKHTEEALERRVAERTAELEAANAALHAEIAERRRTEGKLRQALAWQEAIFEGSRDAMFISDAGSRFTAVNSAACELTGYSRDELLRMHIPDLHEEVDLHAFEAFHDRIFAGEELVSEARIRRKDGRKVDAEFNNRRVTIDGISYMHTVARDVTDRKRAEEELRKSKQVIEGILDAIPVRIFWKDKNLVYLGCNAIFARDAGFADPKDLIGKNDYQMGWRDQAEAYRADDREVIESGCSKPLKEEPQTTPEGNTLTLLTSKVPLRDSSGEVSGLLGTYMDITERKHVEESLRQSEARFKGAFASSTIGMALVALDGRSLEVNPALCRIVGYSEEELLARTFQDITHPDDLDSDLAYIRQLLAGEIPSYQMEKRYLRKQGQVVWALLSVSLVRDRAGQPLYFVSQIQDITEGKLAAQALRESEERYRLIAENTADVIWTLDLATHRFTYVSPSIEKLRGFTPEEMMAQPFEASLTPNSLRRVETLIAATLAAMATGDHSARFGTVETDLPTKGGGVVQAEAVATALTDASGRVTSLLGVTRDISERRRVEAALRESEERYRTLVAHSPDGIFLVDLKGNFLSVNETICRELGFSEAEMLSMSIWDIVPERHWETHKARMARILKGEILDDTVEYEARAKAGQLVPVEVRSAPYRKGEEIVGFQAIARNITGRIELESHLRDVQKMEAVGLLAGGVAHDFNNLLQAMLNHVEVVRSRHADAAQMAATMTGLEADIRRGSALTRQLLLFARRETAKPERLDLNEVIRSAATFLRRLVRANVTFSVEPSEEPLPLTADRGQIDQVLMNLVVNAADAMPGGGRLTIRSGSQGRERVWFSVDDTGSGIPVEVRERIFEPFFTTKTTGKGTGLGLSVVHGIVTQHHGVVEFQDLPSGGTSFRVALPRAGSGAFPKVVPPTADASSRPEGHGERVLVVEDEDTARQALAEILRMLDYDVVAVGSGEDAGLLPHDPGFDVLLTDLMLPGVAGGDLARGLLDRWPKLKVILMSGYAEDEAVRRGALTGRVRFLQKPFDMATLAREIRAALEE